VCASAATLDSPSFSCALRSRRFCFGRWSLFALCFLLERVLLARLLLASATLALCSPSTSESGVFIMYEYLAYSLDFFLRAWRAKKRRRGEDFAPTPN
jgi:hypothetical protein